MKLLRSYPFLAFLLVLLSILGFCLTQQSLVLLIVAGTLAVVSWFVTEGPRGRTIPVWLSHLLVLVVSSIVIIDWYQNKSDWTGVLGRYAVWLSLIKLYEHKSPRDYGQLLAFTLLLMVTSALQSADLLFTVVLLMYSVLGLYVMLLHQLHGAYESEKIQRATLEPRGYRLAPMFKPVIGPRVGVQFKITAFMVGLVGFALSVVLFLAVPRGRGEEAIPGLNLSIQRRTAFLDRVDLGRGSRITPSRRPVMRVQILDEEGRLQRDGPFYIRGGVLEIYLGNGQWRPGTHETVSIQTIPNELTPLAEDLVVDESPRMIQRFKLDLPLDVLPSLSTAFAIKTTRAITLVYDPIAQIVSKPARSSRLQAYEIQSVERPDLETLKRLAHGQTIVRPTQRYRDDDVQALARQLLRDQGVETRRPSDIREVWAWGRRAAQVFHSYLTNGNFAYSLDLRNVSVPKEGQDAIEQFLFETKLGHCEYFASAMTAMCQSLGIQARLVTGYVAWEYDQATEEFVISENNAHAWMEVRVSADQWESFDPTPPEALSVFHDLSPTFPDRMQRMMSRFENGIGSRFLDFNEQDQEDLARVLDMGWSERLQAMWEAARNWARRVNASFQLGWAGYMWMGIVAFALVIAVIALIKLMRRSVLLRNTIKLHDLNGAEYQRMLRQLGFYIDMLYVLRKGGVEKPSWQPPGQYAEALADAKPEVATLVRSITDVFYLARYGGQSLAREEVRDVKQQVTQLASILGVKL
ncbi:MAG: DUF3488 and transglutaminase-like domain-containing protein [Planctomycetota bacterium]|nr:DUF3488 and transglutaminase-like domain-containing protein [Planctomycetota bacterium]